MRRCAVCCVGACRGYLYEAWTYLREGFRDIHTISVRYVSVRYLGSSRTSIPRTSHVHPPYVRTISVLGNISVRYPYDIRTISVLYPYYIRTISVLYPLTWIFQRKSVPYDSHYIRAIPPYLYDIRGRYDIRTISEAYIRRTSVRRL